MSDKHSSFEFLCGNFPAIDVRVIKATILEHGDDIESAVTFLIDSFEEEKDVTHVHNLVDSYKSFLSLTERMEKIDQPIKSETPEIDNREPQKHIKLEDSSGMYDDLLLIDDSLTYLEKKAEAQFALAEMSSEYVDCEQSGIAEYDGFSIAKVSESHKTLDIEQSGMVLCDGSSNVKVTGTECVTESYNTVNMITSKELSTTSLEEIVSEARNDKVYVINLIKEVSDLRAKADEESIAAQKEKAEAAKGGEYLLMKAAEVRTRVLQMKQDNLRRRGEIYGEKAVLALEARELKLRLDQVKQEKEKAVATLLEIRTRLQACYETALEERKNAEIDRKSKEEIAQKALEEEEALMAIEEKESNNLNIEAETSARLRESIMDHGSTIDVLQGEISVLCEDVESFKKQVEEGIWSSTSTASTHSGINPGGPYSFRRCYQLSVDSMQDPRKSFGSDKSNISESRDFIARLGRLYNNASSLSLDQVAYENMTSRGKHNYMTSGSFNESTSIDCLNLEDSTNDEFIYPADANSSLSEPPLGLPQGKTHNYTMQENSLVDVSYGYGMDRNVLQQVLNHKNEDPFHGTKEREDSLIKPAKYIQYSSNLPSRNDSDREWTQRGTVGDWVLTNEQFEGMSLSSSSTTSSLVKLGIDDFTNG